MSEMNYKDYEELVAILDGRIDKLTKPIPSKQILRFAEALRSAKLGDDDAAGTYTHDDYGNLLEAQAIVNECLPKILENIRARTIDSEIGWRFEFVAAANGDADLCAICKKPFQHFGKTVKAHCHDMHPDSYHGVCRDCVREYAPLEFAELDGVEEWLAENRFVSNRVASTNKEDRQKVHLVDAIRRYAHSTHYFGDVVKNASEWAKAAFGEWR